MELEDCESSFVEERELDPEKVKGARLEKVHFMQEMGCGTWATVAESDGTTRSRLVDRDC